MWILGISRSHNGSVALIHNGKVIVAVQAERLSRLKRQALEFKNDKVLISKCVKYCLNKANIDYSDINSVAISTPWDTKQLSNEDLFNFIGGCPKNYQKTYYIPHHYAHAEYALHYSKLSNGIILVVDGSGSKENDRKYFSINENIHSKCISHIHPDGKETVSAYWFDKKNLHLIYRFSPSVLKTHKYNKNSNGFLQSIGHYWRWASNYCCGSHSEAGKVMGLAAFGNPKIYRNLKALSISKDGMIKVNYEKLNKKFNLPNVFGKDLSDNKNYSNIAAMVQSDTENALINILKILKKKHKTETLYYAGGVALNVVANEKIIRSHLFKDVFLNGSVEDNGTAIGAALAVSNLIMQKRISEKVTDYYGKIYSDSEILNSIKKFPFKYELLSEELKYDKIATLLFKNRIVGWFQDGSEFGPRALGNRSIFANPKNKKIKQMLDLLIKQRDKYRPYAPVVLENYAKKYFDIDGISPVMMSGGKVLNKDIPAVTHIDGSARVQTLAKNDNEKLYKLISAFNKISGFPVILNTSFNLPGEPIVESPTDALNSFNNGALEYLCLGNYLISR